ncbi:DUF393 domain-containing protein [Priestia megaterium]|nr:DUF393 domain-containing protein [Priestia megaterium]
MDYDKDSIVFFDGECNFCNRSVQFIIKNDPKGCFQFTSLQSNIAEQLRAKNILPQNPNSIVLMEKEKIFTESTAVLRICKKLNGLWKTLYIFILIPKPLRDIVYKWIARHRYRLFKKNAQCMIPTAELSSRFLSDEQEGEN